MGHAIRVGIPVAKGAAPDRQTYYDQDANSQWRFLDSERRKGETEPTTNPKKPHETDP
jgi:hypothetical protein